MYRISVIIFLAFLSKFSYCLPVHKLESDESEIDPIDFPPDTDITVIRNFTDVDGKNSTKDLFIIKTIVYEIGILTDVGNDTDFDNETHEEINISFFDPDNNGTFVDLSHIPVPIQTNVSGVSITGILPVNFGDLSLLTDGTPTVNGSHFPLYPNKQVRVSHNISTIDKDKSNSILEGLPEILGLKDIWNHNKDDTKEDSSSDELSRWEKKIEHVDTEEIE